MEDYVIGQVNEESCCIFLLGQVYWILGQIDILEGVYEGQLVCVFLGQVEVKMVVSYVYCVQILRFVKEEVNNISFV